MPPFSNEDDEEKRQAVENSDVDMRSDDVDDLLTKGVNMRWC